MSQENKVQLFQEQSIRSHWDADQEKWYFSVQDIVQALSESNDVKQYIKRMRSRNSELNLNWGTICTLVEMRAMDGKKRKIQAADTEGVLRIIQSIPSPKAEPFKASTSSATISTTSSATISTSSATSCYLLRSLTWWVSLSNPLFKWSKPRNLPC